ncbi:hypothetical protein Ari01nite_90180 [Paractinoplanes rishiriensis]|uniref:Uncharacterized protein n=1 Tax=Paractinoplanes rishiriensis TaxID=1050105 RepID=A0A919KAJ8_9ACTN|nr:hypothetical protein Ari01nite_90180 [Actinoplanes rishiriensis]
MGTVPPVASYDPHERIWNPPMPLLFQWQYGGQLRTITSSALRKAINENLLAAGIADTAGHPLRGMSPASWGWIWLLSMAAHVEQQVHAADPAFAVRRDPRLRRRLLRCGHVHFDPPCSADPITTGSQSGAVAAAPDRQATRGR